MCWSCQNIGDARAMGNLSNKSIDEEGTSQRQRSMLQSQNQKERAQTSLTLGIELPDLEFALLGFGRALFQYFFIVPLYAVSI